ncbi:MAG: hypothetical protein IIY32_07625, partial [Thermoguttaceae bacterium]|nr:hypothetical protein [Thermoguttaceae bacterium]
MSREKKPSDWDDLQRMLSGDDASADAAAESEPKKTVKSKKQDDRKAKAPKKKPAADTKKVEEALASVSRESLSADKVDTMLATAAAAVAPKKSRAPKVEEADAEEKA